MKIKYGFLFTVLIVALSMFEALAQTDKDGAKSVVKITTSFTSTEKGKPVKKISSASGWCWKDFTPQHVSRWRRTKQRRKLAIHAKSSHFKDLPRRFAVMSLALLAGDSDGLLFVSERPNRKLAFSMRMLRGTRCFGGLMALAT